MNTHQPFGPKIIVPNISQDTIIALIAAGYDSSQIAEFARCESERINPGAFRQGDIVAEEDGTVFWLRLERFGARWHRFWEAPRKTIVSAEAPKRLPVLIVIQASTYFAFSLAALVVSNRIGAAYITASGNNTYANDALGAALFMGIVPLGAVALKAFGTLVSSSLGKKLFNVIIFALSVPALVLWVMAFAVAFAPSTAGDAARVAAGIRQGDDSFGVLLSCHIAADILLSHTCFAAAERLLLANNRRESIDNPAYLYWQERITTLTRQIDEACSLRAFALDYLAARESVIKATEISIGIQIDRQKAVMAHRAQMATSQAQFDALQ